jgi:hypothetical protein
MRRWLLWCAVLISIASGVTVAAQSASADTPLVISCTGTVRLGGTVTASLVVPADTDCQVMNGQLIGSVTVYSAATFDALDTTIDGAVTAVSGSHVTLQSTTLHGSMALYSVANLNLEGRVVVTGSVTGSIDPVPTIGPSLIQNATIQGRVDLTNDGLPTVVHAYNSTFLGGAKFTRVEPIFESITADRYLVLNDALGPNPSTVIPHIEATVCASTVHGDFTMHDSFGYFELGGGHFCSSPNNPGADYTDHVDGSLILTNNSAGDIHVSATIGGDAVCRGNFPNPKIGSLGATVAGKSIEDCAAFPHSA